MANAVDWSQYAYSLYATDNHYLCNAVMIMESLHRLGSKAERLILYNEQWILSPNTYEGKLLVRAMDKYGATLKPVKVVRHGDSFTWQDSFTKLLAFNQTQYKRVLSLDSDSTVMQNMDELFLMDSAPVAAPQAYWLKDFTLSSQIMLIEPNATQYARITQDELGLKENDFDMEVLNHLWKNDSMPIPWRPYDLITGEFKSADHSNYLGSKEEVWNATEILNEVKFLHFSDWPVPKPWLPHAASEVDKIVEGCAYDSKMDCDSVKVWEGIYKDFWKRRETVCNDLYDTRGGHLKAP
ncbi:glycosyltransferase family 8 protein [Myriangium duriaei CBS 260.36]|uniref:Glycosyltransferase family 8 protein n=1 Tax=Myriangium duriaei CBS 260.36 TaxID=1168546 RepID=A0A9P4MJQ3_9PEZI|nr:glycosyltransferase family 8 protein [Myriangium duriaei CBS 260.36]